MKQIGKSTLRSASGRRRVRRLLPVLLAALSVAAAPPAHAQAQARGQGWETAGERSPLQREIADRSKKDLREFYAARDFRPLWLSDLGQPSVATAVLLHRLRTAQFDGVDPAILQMAKLDKAVERARRGDKDDVAKADVELSRAFGAYVQAMRAAPREGMIYESRALAPVVPTAESALQEAAAYSDDPTAMAEYLSGMRWMHPLYAAMRTAMEDPRFSESERRVIWTNLARVRAIPAIPKGRHILVDAASARLWMYEDGQVVDSMKVVVGKPDLQTPQMAGFIRQAIVNPYWNVPDDLTQKNIAANVIARGVGYLKSGGYQVFDGWGAEAPLIDPKKIDWHEVAQGRKRIRVRQLPGGSNFMGKVKFEFPNDQGIYLHDTPDKHLLNEEARQLSSGCVRLEDAGRLHQWLMGTPLPAKLRGDPERAVRLPEMVPVYITYLTARPEGGDIAFHDDPYARDGIQFAAVRNDLAVTDRP